MTGRASHDGGRPERGASSRTLGGFPILQPYVPGRGAPATAARADSSIAAGAPAPAEPCAIADLCERVACAEDAAEAARLVLAGLSRALGVERVALALDMPRLALESAPPLRGAPGIGRVAGRAHITRPLWLLSSPSTRLVHSAEAAVTAGSASFGSVRIERTAQRLDAEEWGSLRIVAIALGQRLAVLTMMEAGVHQAGAQRTPLRSLPVDTAFPEGVRDADDERAGQERQRWDRFLASIAHEVRTPLTSISGHAQLVERAVRAARGPDGALKRGAAARVLAAVERHLPPLERQVARIERLIRDALDLGEVEAGSLALELAECDAVELARRAVASATSTGAGGGTFEPRLEVDMPETLALRCAATRVERALGRMIEHVAHAQGDTGELTIRVRETVHDGAHYASFAVAGEREGRESAAASTDEVSADEVSADEVSARALPRDLGLALSAAVARIHGGRLERGDRAAGEGDAELTLLLPIGGPRGQRTHERRQEDGADATDRRGG